MKTLHLVLKSKWYDKIASGEKTSEYRECKPYWNKRFGGYDNIVGYVLTADCCRYDRVIFHCGYIRYDHCAPARPDEIQFWAAAPQ